MKLEQFINPCCTSASKLYCESFTGDSTRSNTYTLIIEKGVPIIPCLFEEEALSVYEQDVLIPPLYVSRYFINNDYKKIHIKRVLHDREDNAECEEENCCNSSSPTQTPVITLTKSKNNKCCLYLYNFSAACYHPLYPLKR